MLIKIHLLINQKFIGDKNQALGIKKRLEEQYSGVKIPIYEWNDANKEELRTLREEIKNNSKYEHVIIAIGDHGLDAYETLDIKLIKNKVAVWTSHQFIPKLYQMIPEIDLIALSPSILNNALRQRIPTNKLVEIRGVAHHVDPALLKESKNNWQIESKDPILPSDHYIGVILGGDVVDSSGKIHFFTPTETEQLTYFIKQIAEKHFKDKNFQILITNSPRTGKYNPDTKAEIKVHTSDSPLDLISKTFLDTLNKIELKNYQFFNYEMNKPSAYLAILATLQGGQSNIAVVTGDSSSMVNEISDSITVEHVYVIKVRSMIEAHIVILKDIGISHVIDLDLGENINIHKVDQKGFISQIPAALTIAKAIALILKNKLILGPDPVIQPGITSLLAKSGMGININIEKKSDLTTESIKKIIPHVSAKNIPLCYLI